MTFVLYCNLTFVVVYFKVIIIYITRTCSKSSEDQEHLKYCHRHEIVAYQSPWYNTLLLAGNKTLINNPNVSQEPQSSFATLLSFESDSFFPSSAAFPSRHGRFMVVARWPAAVRHVASLDLLTLPSSHRTQHITLHRDHLAR